MGDLSDDLDSVSITLSFESRRHGGDMVVESTERFEFLFHVDAKVPGVVMVKDRDVSPHRRASYGEG